LFGGWLQRTALAAVLIANWLAGDQESQSRFVFAALLSRIGSTAVLLLVCMRSNERLRQQNGALEALASSSSSSGGGLSRLSLNLDHAVHRARKIALTSSLSSVSSFGLCWNIREFDTCSALLPLCGSHIPGSSKSPAKISPRAFRSV